MLAKYCALPLVGVLCLSLASSAHDPITTKITWDREVVRIVNARCVSCHQEGGRAFSLTTYKDARPWAQDILDQTLARQMPPWGAVKGFGDLKDDQSLTQDQLDLIANWVDGGAPEGEAGDLPASPAITAFTPIQEQAKEEIIISGDFKTPRSLVLEGLWPKTVQDNASLQITAELPDGSIVPLLWLEGYKKEFDHPFLFQAPLGLPAGTAIHGIPIDAKIALMLSGHQGKAGIAARSEGSN
jgi:hypothetical protein